jgi:hypothetical protein
MSELVSILAEPRDEVYATLVDFADRMGSLFSLVWRDQFRFSESAYAIDQALAEARISSESSDSWPGTRLSGHRATVGLYRLNPSALKILVPPGGLFAWRSPHLPEDLAFYTPAGRPWLGSIAHERDAFLYADAVSLRDVRVAVPGLLLEAG